MSTTVGPFGVPLDPTNVGYDVWMLAGQSNMVGFGTGIDTAYLDAADPRVAQWPNPGASTVYTGLIATAIDALFHFRAGTSVVGHAMTFSKLKVRELPANRRIALVPCASGGTSFGNTSNASGTWDRTALTGYPLLPQLAIIEANKVMALNPLNRFRGILWHQGEGDSGMAAATYQGYLDDLIDYFRANITGAANSLFLVGEILDAYVAANPTNMPGIRAVHIDTPRRKTRCGYYYGPASLTDSTMQNGDNTHYSAKGQRVLGANCAAAALLAVADVMGTAPVTPGAITFVQAGTTVSISWVRTAGRVTNYLVEYNTGSGWTTQTRTNNIDNTATFTSLASGTTLQVRVSAINEQGTSSPSAASYRVLYVPGQATLALGSPGFSSIPYTITAPAVDGTHDAATSYLIEYKQHSSGSWLTFATVTALTGSVTGLANNTQYDVRATAINAAGNSASPSTTQTATTLALTIYLDDVVTAGLTLSTAYRAFGLRKLRAAYAGFAVQVQRSSDNATMDVGFVTSGALDSATMLAWSGSDTVRIKTWYDQGSGGRNITQSTFANQMLLVSAGVLQTLNGLATAITDTNTVVYSDAVNVGLYAAGVSSVQYVGRVGVINGGVLACEKKNASSEYYAMTTSTGTGGTSAAQIVDDSAVKFANLVGTIATGAALSQQTMLDSGTLMSQRTNGAAGGSVAYTRAGHTVTLTSYAFGQLVASAWWQSGSVSEHIEFTVALTSAEYLAGEANQKNYYGTP